MPRLVKIITPSSPSGSGPKNEMNAPFIPFVDSAVFCESSASARQACRIASMSGKSRVQPGCSASCQASQASQAPQEVSAPEAAPEAPSGEWTCPRCGSANDGNFCPNCGLARPWLCPGCGRENPSDNNFCPNCGTPSPQGKED